MIRGLCDHPQIVSYEKDRHMEFLHQILHQLQNLGLDGDVQCCGRLIGDQQLRFGGKRHGDHRALTHAAR